MIGKTVSHYEILEHLGGGGMGVGYEAEDTRLERILALNHANVCAFYDVAEEDGQQFIVMEYVDGVTLRAKSAEGAAQLEKSGYGGSCPNCTFTVHFRGVSQQGLAAVGEFRLL
jgi:serine/threonine protein kinase